MKLRSIALAIGALAVTGAASAAVFPDFKVDPDLASPLTNFTADKITGNYAEVITFGPGNTFTVSLKWQAGQFVANDGIDPLANGTTRLDNDYRLYATFTGSGTTSVSGAATTFTLNPGGLVSFYFDDLLDTTLTAPATGASPWTRANIADDLLLASGAAISGAGTLDPSLSTCGSSGGINCGSFGQTTGFALTADGKKFFIDPVPFYEVSFQSGQLNNFDPSGTQLINGSLDLVFAAPVPEPATLALVGLALVGMGAAARRRRT